MSSRRSPGAGGGRVPLARSFAFRLGAAFAVVAIASAGITALVVNAAFTARFSHYLAQQQHAQVTQITTAAGRAYAGKGKWDLHALDTLVRPPVPRPCGSSPRRGRMSGSGTATR